MSRDLKKCCIIGLGSAAESALIMFMWFLIGALFGEEYSVSYGFFYGFQFLFWGAICFAGGACVNAGLCKDKDQQYSGVLIAVFIELVLYLISMAFSTEILQILHAPAYLLGTYQFSISYNSCSLILNSVIKPLVFKDKEALQTKLRISYAILLDIVLLLSGIVVHDMQFSFLATLCAAAIFIIICTIKLVDIKKLSIHLLRWAKLSAYGLTAQCGLTAIYICNTYKLATFSYAFIATDTLLDYATDLQWDASDAHTTLAEVKLSEGKYDNRHMYKVSFAYMGILAFSTLITLLFWYNNGYSDIDIGLLWFGMGIQFFNLLLNPLYALNRSEFTIKASGRAAFFAALVSVAARTLVALLLPTPLAAYYAQIVHLVVNIIVYKIAVKYAVSGHSLTI